MMLAVRCKSSFDAGVRTRGHRYFRQRRVSFTDERSGQLQATVEGDSGAYEVKISWPDTGGGPLIASCTCPYSEGGALCKHVWATLLEMDLVGMHVAIPGKQSLKVRPAGEVMVAPRDRSQSAQPNSAEDGDEFPSDEAQMMPIGRRQRGQKLAKLIAAAKTERGVQQADWERLLQRVKRASAPSDREPSGIGLGGGRLYRRGERRLLYCLNVSGSMGRNRLQIDLLESLRKKNGEYGKPRRLSLVQEEIATLESPEDRELLAVMSQVTTDTERSSNYGSYFYSRVPRWSSVTVPGLLGEAVLPRLCATGRFRWLLDPSLSVEEAHPVTWSGETWRFRLHVVPDADHATWRLQGEFVLGDRSLPLSACTLVTQDGWLLAEDRLSRLEPREAWPWIDQLRKEGTIEVPFADRERLLKSLCAIPELPDLQLPEAWQCSPLRIPPRGQIMLNSTEAWKQNSVLLGEVFFEYGDQVFSAQATDSAVLNEGQQLVLRDPEAERQLWQQLWDQGISLSESLFNRAQEQKVEIPSSRFVETVERLTELGWNVCSAGRKLRRPGQFSLSVTSGVDWFDLSGEFDFDGASASLASLLRAMRNGQSFVKLDDGSHGLLPEEWLRKYAQLADLGKQEGEQLRFAPSQTLLLDALLSEQDDVQIDQQFAAFRRQLKSFNGVKPVRAPRGFRGELRSYQEDGLGWLKFLQKFRLGGCLADDMGLGKTVQVLAQLESRRHRTVEPGETKKPSLVVVPKSLVFNWIEESQRFAPRLRVFNYTGLDRSERWAAAQAKGEVDLIVTTYGTVRRDILTLREMAFDYVILDESQAIKNHQSLAAKACRLLSADHRLAMTGTPIENHIGELWSLFEFLNPGMLGRSSAYANLTAEGADQESLQRLAQGIRPFLLRRTKQQVLTELPEKTEQTLHCELPSKQKKLYEELRDYFRVQLNERVASNGLERSKMHVLEALLRLRQAACHPGLLDPKRSGETSGKLDVLFEQLDSILAEGHKALVFSQFTSLLAIVKRHLGERGWTYEYLDGQTRDRGACVRHFQEDPTCQLFLVSLKAGGHGLNLTAADYVFILDPWWNPAVEAQAVDRAHRMGQEKPVFAYRLISKGTVEEKIVELQQSKRELADAIVSADNSLLKNLTADDLQMLLS